MGTDDHTAKVLNLDKRLSNPRENLAALSNAARSKEGKEGEV